MTNTSKSATQVLQDAIFSSVMDAFAALKTNAGGMPNALMRDLNSMHSNCAIGDLPEGIQKAIQSSTQDALKRLQREGYAVSPKSPVRLTAPLKRAHR